MHTHAKKIAVTTVLFLLSLIASPVAQGIEGQQNGSLTVTIDDSSSKSSQIISGMDSSLGSFRFQTDDFEGVNIQSIKFRNLGSIDSISAGLLRLYHGSNQIGGYVALSTWDKTVEFYPNYLMPANTSVVFEVKTTTSQNISGETLQLKVDNVMAQGLTTGTQISVFSNPTAKLKTIYPTKLTVSLPLYPVPVPINFVGSQLEVARFVIGAAVAHPDNSNAFITITGLRFQKVGQETLTNYTLQVISDDGSPPMALASNANSSKFLNTTAGGNMAPITLYQGQTRTYRIVADVAANASNQTVQLQFMAGEGNISPFSQTGSATWSVTNPNTGITQTTTLTDLNGEIFVAISPRTALFASDTTAPTIVSVSTNSQVGTSNNGVIDEEFLITFSERMNPITIDPRLVYGGSYQCTSPTSATGCIQVKKIGPRTVISIKGIVDIQGGLYANMNNTPDQQWRGIVSLNADGTQLRITTTVSSGQLNSNPANFSSGNHSLGIKTQISRDTASNKVSGVALGANALANVDF